MRVTVTGAIGLIGTRVVAALQERGDEVTVLSRRPEHAYRLLEVDAVGWNPLAEPAPTEGLGAATASYTSPARRSPNAGPRRASNAIRSSREFGTARLVEGLAQAEPRPRVLVSASAVGYYSAE